MQLIHTVIDDLQALRDDDVTPMGAALAELLGGERGPLIDLADRFTQADLGEIMASWIGNGPKLSISMHDLRRVLGESWAEELATLAGLESEAFLRRLVGLRPDAVHRMTPGPGLETAMEPARPHHG
jgi:uncharacterized protein YidB (DUF937 family)